MFFDPATLSSLGGLAGLGGTKVKVSSTTTSGVNSVINNIPGAGSNATSTPTQTQRQEASTLGDGGASLPSFGGSSPSPRPSPRPNFGGGSGGFDIPPLLLFGGLGAVGFVLFQRFSGGNKPKKKGRK